MPRFKFRSMDKRGQANEGTVSAPNMAALQELLKQQGQFMISATPISEQTAAAKAAAAAAAPAKAEKKVRAMVRARRVSDEDVCIFNGQLSLMLRAALPILESISTLVLQEKNPTMKKALNEIVASIQGGSSMSAAFAKHPDIFDEVYLSMIEAGESCGTLPKMIERISEYLDFKVSVRARIKSAMVYPVIVMSAAFLIVGALIIFVLPIFAEVFEQFDAELPPITLFLLGLSSSLRGFWYVWIGYACVVFWRARSWVKDPDHLRAIHLVSLRAPVIGPVVKSIVLARVTRIMGELLRGGVPILRSIELARASAGNIIIAEVLEKMAEEVTAGNPVYMSLGASEDIPEMVSHLVAGAEKTGKLPEALSFISDFYQREVDTTMRSLFAAIEPIFIVFLGLAIGGIAVSMLLPIFQLGGAAG